MEYSYGGAVTCTHKGSRPHGQLVHTQGSSPYLDAVDWPSWVQLPPRKRLFPILTEWGRSKAGDSSCDLQDDMSSTLVTGSTCSSDMCHMFLGHVTLSHSILKTWKYYVLCRIDIRATLKEYFPSLTTTANYMWVPILNESIDRYYIITANQWMDIRLDSATILPSIEITYATGQSCNIVVLFPHSMRFGDWRGGQCNNTCPHRNHMCLGPELLHRLSTT